MADFASKGVAGAGLGLGIAGTALGLLNNGGLNLGGLLGGGWNNAGTAMGLGVMAEKDAEIAKLRAEKYSDKNDVEVYAQTRRENQDLGDRLLGNWIRPLAQEAASNRETIARIEERMACMNKTADLREENLRQKIDCVANEAAHGIANVGAGLASLRHVVDNITITHIPASAICPEVMPRWNAWEAPTADAPATQPISGTVRVTK